MTGERQTSKQIEIERKRDIQMYIQTSRHSENYNT